MKGRRGGSGAGGPRAAAVPLARRPGRGRRLRVGVIFGGRSVEHEISHVSARAVMKALDERGYEVVPIAVSKTGRWLARGAHHALPADPSVRGLICLRDGGRGGRAPISVARRRADLARRALDVVFPVMHGAGGEDGSLQGLLELADIPYVGAGVLGSALGMDKAMMKVAFRAAGLPIVDHRVVRRRDLKEVERIVDVLESAFGYPCFVKPSNGGSSVGVSKARNRAGLVRGLHLAARYDRTLIVERAIRAREIECSVLGNDAPVASVVGEIIPAGEFYDYRAKYVDPSSRLVIPADVSEAQSRRVREIAVRAFRTLDLAGMARVDFFLDRSTEAIFLNEVNTLPGFTPISMYPKLWEASGLPFPELVERLVGLALERHAEKRTFVRSYDPRGDRRRDAP
ncbi:MAG: D-alanine--D-alanine ligase family protein [Acidobacteriota bacterium]